jgi:hypothetical protein
MLTLFNDERRNIARYLLRGTNSHYDTLASNLQETCKFSNDVTIKNLLLGKYGYEHNKQCVIYELPTYELMYVISYIANLHHITFCMEFQSMTGILTSMLKLFNDRITYGACNDVSSSDTIGYKYCNIKKYSLFNLLLGGTQCKTGSMFILNWPTTDVLNCIEDLLKMIDCGVVCVIHDKFNPIVLEDEEGINEKYHVLKLNLKQICYRDNKTNIGHYSYSTTTFYINKTLIMQYHSTDALLSSAFAPYVFSNDVQLTEPMICDELMHNMQIPQCAKELSTTELKLLIDKYHEINIDGAIICPLFLNTVDELKMWLKMLSYSITPILNGIHDRKKYDNFIKLSKMLYEQNGLNTLKSIGAISTWVPNENIALVFLVLDYSTQSNDKKWKDNVFKMYRYLTHNRRY